MNEVSKPPLVILKEQIDARDGEFKAALPSHIPVDKFKRVLLTAISQNPDLLAVERRSLFNACMLAAQDGLLPDGREGAIVKFKDKTRGAIAQWMPMVAGLRKKVRLAGEVVNWEVHVVYERDEFLYELGDEPMIRHKPYLGADRGKPIAVYSIATLKSGERSREIMSVGEINKIRSLSRTSEGGPWVSHWGEMARKTVARRHSKTLPMSTDIEATFRRDDALYNIEPKNNFPLEDTSANGRPSIAERLDRLASLRSSEPVALDPPHDPETGEIIDSTTSETEVMLNEPLDGSEPLHNTMANHIEGPVTGRFSSDELLLKTLLDARNKAREGGRQFTRWLKTLGAPEYSRLEGHMDELRALATKADEARQ